MVSVRFRQVKCITADYVNYEVVECWFEPSGCRRRPRVRSFTCL